METTAILNILIMLSVFGILLGIAITDLFTYTIPHELNLGLFVLGVVYYFVNFDSKNFLSPIIMFVSMLLFNVALQAILIWKKGDGFGMGDSIMLIALSFFLKTENIIFFLSTFAIVCAICAVFMLIVKKDQIPMGDFIALALMGTIIYSYTNNFWISIISMIIFVCVTLLVYLSFKNTIRECKEQMSLEIKEAPIDSEEFLNKFDSTNITKGGDDEKNI